ncbi:hypothetical protein BJX66DRAFT_312642 [Aspergillus keveii]|uniref:Secreted protein n=1 Tax=Aspergillus keveii TaxID=714993 RepID=A0ABR4FTF3_9EURO
MTRATLAGIIAIRISIWSTQPNNVALCACSGVRLILWTPTPLIAPNVRNTMLAVPITIAMETQYKSP